VKGSACRINQYPNKSAVMVLLCEENTEGSGVPGTFISGKEKK
jgi:hypothetical protein